MKSFFIIPILALSFSFQNPCSKSSRHVTHTPSEDDKIYDIKVANPSFQSLPRAYKVKGEFESSEVNVLTAKGDGAIEQVFVGVGDKVLQDDPVVTISNSEILDQIELLRLKVKELEARLKNAEGNLNNLDTDDRPVTTEEVGFLDDDEALIEDTQAQKTLTQTESSEEPKTLKGLVETIESMIDVRSKKISVLDKKLLELSQKSPVNGVVTRIYVTENNNVNEGDNLVEISKLDPISLKFDLPKDIASFVDKYSQVKVLKVDADATSADGTVYFVSPNIDAQKNTITTRAHVNNPEHRLKGGQKVELEVVTRRIDRILQLPKVAVATQKDKSFIFVVAGQQVHLVEIEAGREFADGMVEIKAADVRTEDRVVVNPTTELKNNSFVKVLKEELKPKPVEEAVQEPVQEPVQEEMNTVEELPENENSAIEENN